MKMYKLVFFILIAVASLALLIPLFTDDAGLIPAWMTAEPYPLVFLILWVLIIIGSFVEMLR
jgi:hypothetical protein